MFKAINAIVLTMNGAKYLVACEDTGNGSRIILNLKISNSN